MKAICIARETELEVANLNLPDCPADSHLHVRMEGSAINPGDKYFLQNPAARAALKAGKYPTWGASGCGEVVAVGKNVPDGYLGKRVAIYRSLVRTPETIGLWCDTAQVHYLSTVILPDSVNALDYSGSLVNVITAYAFLNQIIDDGHKGVIATAGSSATGRALLKLAEARNIPALGIVRTSSQRQALAEQGFTNILASTDHNFENDFSKKSQELTTTAVFEGVGGDLVTQLVPLLPLQSTLYCYGFLTGPSTFTMQSRMLLEKNLTLRGFSNFTTTTVQNQDQLAKTLEVLSNLIEAPVFRTKLGPQFTFDQIGEAMSYQGINGEKAVLLPQAKYD